jgi:hypothetical protein
MAVLSAVFALADNKPTKQTIAQSAAGAEVAVGADNIICVVATGDCHIALGATGMGAPDATNFYIPAKSFVQIDTGNKGFIRVFNPTASNIDVFIQQMAV